MSAPARLARLAREAGVQRFVHVSAIGADPRSPSAYARTKAAGEEAVRDAFPTATILRPSIVFGPEDQFFNRLAALAMISPVIPLIGGGETRFQPVYVGDVADAVVRVIDDPATAGRTYELGGPKVYSLRALVELLLAEIRRKRLLIDLPFGLAALQARLMSLLPNPPLTPDQVEMLKRDNVVSSGALTLARSASRRLRSRRSCRAISTASAAAAGTRAKTRLDEGARGCRWRWEFDRDLYSLAAHGGSSMVA